MRARVELRRVCLVLVSRAKRWVPPLAADAPADRPDSTGGLFRQRCFQSAFVHVYKRSAKIRMGAATYLVVLAVRLTVRGIENWISMSPLSPCLRPARPYNCRPVRHSACFTMHDQTQPNAAQQPTSRPTSEATQRLSRCRALSSTHGVQNETGTGSVAAAALGPGKW